MASSEDRSAPTWAELFERAADREVTVAAVRSALERVRDAR